MGGLGRRGRPARAGVRGGAVRAPALGRLLIGHHRAAEADHARSRRHRPGAPQGALFPSGSAAGRCLHLVHHDRLDDVELPGRGAAGGPDDRALRRQRHLPGHGPAVAAGGRARRQLSGRRGALPGGLHEGGPAPGYGKRPVGAARHRLDRIAAAARGVRLGVRAGQARPAARVLLGRHRPVHRLRRALPAAAGAGRGDLRALPGARVEAYDENGKPVVGQVGELVITQPMPSMPVGFWNDPAGIRYQESYFDIYPGIWRHGDWIELLPDGGCIIYGRSDATLNRGGVRMGTSEFYRAVEAFDEIDDSLVVDTGRLGAEGRLILYVVPAAGSELDDDLKNRLRAVLRAQLSPRHVPDEIHQVPGIPRTLSGKKLEVPVRKILHGADPEQAADPNALADPDALRYFGRFQGAGEDADSPRLRKETSLSQRGGRVLAGR